MKKYDLKTIYEWSAIPQAFVIGLICIIVYFIGDRVDTSTLKIKLFNSEQQEQSLKQQMGLIINEEQSVKNDISQFAKYNAMLTAWHKQMINYSDLPELLNQILKIGSNNQLHFALFSPGSEIKENLYYRVPIKLIVVGSYHQLANFISQVANLSWIVVVDDFTISKENTNDVLGAKLAEQANAENLLTAGIVLDVYYLTEKK